MIPHIEFETVTKQYVRASSKTPSTLDGFSWVIPRGARRLLLGPNGSGKTTLLKMACGFVLPDRGTVRVAGKSAHLADRSGLGVMFSIHLLYPTLTGRENLAHSARIYGTGDAAVKEAIARWELSEICDRAVETYSNGQRALLALARATVHSPDLLLLDEPLAYLDPSHIQTLKKNLGRYSGTLLISSQQRNEFDGVIDEERYL